MEKSEKLQDLGVKLDVQVEYVSALSLALQQNAIPVIEEIRIRNTSGEDLTDISCEIKAVPGCITPKTLVIDSIKSGEERVLTDIGVEPDFQYVVSLSEMAYCKMSLVVRAQERVLFQQEYDIHACTAEQWLGSKCIPELICSFVTPNAEVVNALMSTVASELQKATGDKDINGYQRGRERAYAICTAIYRAIHSLGITYAEPAASFSVAGQRIRLADTICKYRLATCLDLTVLFASVMEQCGLHPVIMLQESHAYIGCHLVERYFPENVMTDLQAIRKLVALDEFTVIETTMVTGGASFSEAEATARQNHLNVDEEFHCAIDVIRARHSDIRPLPLKMTDAGVVFDPKMPSVEKLDAEGHRHLQEEVDLESLDTTHTLNPRLEKWTQKLLDLSLRNRMLNVRDGQQTIFLASSDISKVEDRLAGSDQLQIRSLESLLSDKDLHDFAMLRNSAAKPEIQELLKKELSQKRLWALVPEKVLVGRLSKIARQSLTNLEEGGVNTLFLAVGFLEWRPTPTEKKSYQAPILLVPVRLTRKGVSEGYRLSRIDEDTIINETLLELLRSQYKLTIPGLSPLPTDDAGVDVSLVMQILRQSIKDMVGWEVREEMCLGNFSFGKFIMWNDMKARGDELQKHPLVNHLMSGASGYSDGVEVFAPEEVGKCLKLEELYCPMSADSSQLTAVLYSALGKSFVLYGPPGTGKSQTITNLIAHNMSLGRRVLFVSEKKAALDVVHKRLSKIGLRPFCLELHSNKAGKTAVLSQFDEALQVPASNQGIPWDEMVNTLDKTRQGLNQYVEALHYVYPNGLSAFECFSKLFEHPRKLRGSYLPEGDLLTHPKSDYDGLLEIIEAYQRAWLDTTPDARIALESVKDATWTPIYEASLTDAAKAFLEASGHFARAYAEVREWLGLDGADDFRQVRGTLALYAALEGVSGIPGQFLADDISEKASLLQEYTERAAHRDEIGQSLSNFRLEKLSDYDWSGIEARIQQNQQSFCLVRFFKNRSLLKELAGIKKLGATALTLPELCEALPKVVEYLDVQRDISAREATVKGILGDLWREEQTDWTQVLSGAKKAGELVEHVCGMTEAGSSARSSLYARLREIVGSSRAMAAPSVGKCFVDFQKSLDSWSAYAVVSEDEHQTLGELRDVAKGILACVFELRKELLYREERSSALSAGLGNFVRAVESDELPDGDLLSEFQALYYDEMLTAIVNHSDVLRKFSGATQNDRVRQFRAYDQEYMKLSKEIAFARLASKLPRGRFEERKLENTELGILKRECLKKARQLPVRQLLQQIPNLWPLLKPCFLMSPLSVAQYLPPDASSFDLVVFDEASQIPVWDSIGVIARAKQLIVVGDPKQMPPTNFFQKGESESEELDDEELEQIPDMESILTECLAAGVDQTYLNWHYRSRHESLIAFSNHYYYEDRLCTFPSAGNPENMGVKFHFVADGVYERRGKRTNLPEAKALVAYVVQQLATAPKKRSAGVVTFSEAQRDLIEELLESERSAHPELESYFSDGNEEPFFVKNLENVQGDERDVILFSICYAPTADGHFYMNFGPLNRDGGERRLNVAITRAKEQVVVFSSIHGEQINLERTSAVGAKHLRQFLDYAEHGLPAQAQDASAGAFATTGLIASIGHFLEGQGYQIVRAVGCSGYRIDLAVKNPKNSQEYILGIEGDGRVYASQKTTRDREEIRDSVLRSLGWNTYRAWSVDWFFNRERCQKELLALLEKLVAGETVDAGAPPPPVCVHAVESVPNPAEESPAHRREYTMWKPTSALRLTSAEFVNPMKRRLIRTQIQEIIQTEAPILQEVLQKRLLKAWGVMRMSGDVQTTLEAVMRDVHAVDGVVWADGQNPADYPYYRANQEGENGRSLEEIPKVEIANAMEEVRRDYMPKEEDTLYRETLRLLGLPAVVNAKAREILGAFGG